MEDKQNARLNFKTLNFYEKNILFTDYVSWV